MLSFELEQVHGQLRVFGDATGLSLLRREIDLLLEGETHSHLMTAEWGGSELATEMHAEGNRIIHQVNIVRVPDGGLPPLPSA